MVNTEKGSLYNSIGKMNLRTKTLITIGITVFILIAVVISSLLINSADITTNFQAMNQAPSFEHLFGTDWMGRDMFTRTLKGLGLSVQIGAGASVLSSLIAIGIAFLSSISYIFFYSSNLPPFLLPYLHQLPKLPMPHRSLQLFAQGIVFDLTKTCLCHRI